MNNIITITSAKLKPEVILLKIWIRIMGIFMALLQNTSIISWKSAPIGRENWITRRNPATCRKYKTNMT